MKKSVKFFVRGQTPFLLTKMVSVPYLSLFLLCLLIPSLAFAEESVQEYLDRLHSEGKERVMVEFRGEVEPSTIERYGGRVIRGFNTINGLLCEVPQESIEQLKKEDNVLAVVPDILIEIQRDEEERIRDPEELAIEERLKEEYSGRIEEEYHSRIYEAERKYNEALSEYRMRTRPIMELYLRLSSRYRELRYERLRWLYNYLLSRCISILKSYYATYDRALKEYRQRIEEAENTYREAQSELEERISEEISLDYSGPVEIRWNNLEAGLNSKAAWDRYGLSGSGVTIAIIDTGVNYTLPDLKDNYLGGKDIRGNDDDPITRDPNEWHGTNVASLVVGKGVSKIVGVSYNAGFYAIRYADSSNVGTVGDVISGIEWATEKGVDIISMSLGLYSDVPGWDYWGPKFEEVCNAAYRRGIVLVAGSGNDGYSYSAYPAGFHNVISVGMYGEDQVIRVTSNGGVDVVAPGVRVYVIDPLNNLWWATGTSFATPHASGLIALQIEYARKNKIDYNNGYLWEVMKHGAIDLGQSSTYQGKGKIYAAGTQGAFLQAQELYLNALAAHLPQTGYGDDESGYGNISLAPSGTPSLFDRRGAAKIGSIDLMDMSWPLTYVFDYPGSFLWQGYPAYYAGTLGHQDMTLVNLTDVIGNEPEDIYRLDATSTHRYLDTGVRIPGESIERFSGFEPITLDRGTSILLPNDYFLPLELELGLYRTQLDLEYRFRNIFRDIEMTDNESTIWCPPARVSDPPGRRINWGQRLFNWGQRLLLRVIKS